MRRRRLHRRLLWKRAFPRSPCVSALVVLACFVECCLSSLPRHKPLESINCALMGALPSNFHRLHACMHDAPGHTVMRRSTCLWHGPTLLQVAMLATARAVVFLQAPYSLAQLAVSSMLCSGACRAAARSVEKGWG